MEYNYNISKEEAAKRVDPEYFTSIKCLDFDSPEFKALSESDKEVVKHLCRAAYWIDVISYMLDNKHNINFLQFVSDKASKGDQYSANILRLFRAQKSTTAFDINGGKIKLAKEIDETKGKNFYQFDIDTEAFYAIVNDMINVGQVDELKKIFSTRSVVKFVEGKMIGVDYVDQFRTEFAKCADELDMASKCCTDKEFARYLIAQAKALRTANPRLDAEADKLWAKLDKTKFEFTITREQYADELTPLIFANEQLANRLLNLGIDVQPKDSIGARVGLVNPEGTKTLNKLNKINEISSKLMPYRDEYANSVVKDSVSQIAVDVDLIALTGDEGAYSAGIVLAQNLPNNDKLSLKLGGGRKNVYHRQIRNIRSSKAYEHILAPEFIAMFNPEADHWATIEHENTHSLGPKDTKALGEYASILEEYKADMGMFAFLREYIEAGYFTTQQAYQIIVTDMFSNFGKTKPNLSQAHRVRSVMITNRMLEAKALLYKDGRLYFDYDKVIDTAKIMLAEVVRLQLDKSQAKAKEYIEKYFVWTSVHEDIANTIKKYNKKLNGELVEPIYDEYTKDLKPIY